jgi:hypothetical protein
VDLAFRIATSVSAMVLVSRSQLDRQIPTKVPTNLAAAPAIERTRPNAERLLHSDFIEKFEPARTCANGGGLQDGAQGQN